MLGTLLRAGLLAVVVPLTGIGLGAQTVRGVVYQPDSLTPAGGVLVELVDATGNAATRALTDHRGLFALRATASGSYHVRALRIGFRPAATPQFPVTTDSVPNIRLVLTGERITLDLITVRERTSCRTRGNAGAEVVAVWEEVRKALAATSLTSAAGNVVSRVITFERAIDESQVVTFLRTSLAETREARVFRSLPADRLASSGYVVIEGDEVVYFGPDADVLISDSFVSTHCFRLTPATERDTALIHLSFEPSGRRRNLVDVRGTLALDRRSLELRELTFEYVGMPGEAQRLRPGGRVLFARTDDGSWFVQRWLMRMPVMTIYRAAGDRRTEASGLRESTDVDVSEIREAGGELLSALRDDSIVFSGNTRTISGRVRGEGATKSVAQIRVFLSGTDYEVHPDSMGGFTFRDVLPGRYRIGASSPALDSLGFVFPAEVVDVTGASAEGVEVALPGAGEALARLCGGLAGGQAMAMVRGTVREASGAPVPGARLMLQWTAPEAGAPGRGRKVEDRAFGADDAGNYRFCGVPRGSDVSLVAIDGSRRTRAFTGRTSPGSAHLLITLTFP